MKKLTYWVAACLYDDPCYNLRYRTKREIVKAVERFSTLHVYAKPVKIIVEYNDAFSLVNTVLSTWNFDGQQYNPNPKGKDQ